MALSVFSEITPLPERASGTKPDADGELWNTRYTEVNLNFELLEGGAPGEFWAAGGGWAIPAGTGITNGHVIQDEGTPLTQRSNLDFIGGGVTAADGATATEVTILSSAEEIAAAPEKTTPVDADKLDIFDSAAAGVLKWLSWANVKATLKTYFDGLYSDGSLLSINGAKLIWDSVSGYTVGASDKFLAENGDILQLTSDNAVTGLTSLTASTWYHIYAYLSGGVTTIETVTTAPVAWKGSAYSKTGDTSRRYLGSILTAGASTDGYSSGDIISFEHSASFIEYRNFNNDNFRVLTAGTSTTEQAVDCSAFIPVTANIVYAYFINLADATVYFSDATGVSGTQKTLLLTSGDTTRRDMQAQIPVTSQSIYYVMASAVGSGAAYADVIGYYFER